MDNCQLEFNKYLSDLVNNFGVKSQEGAKVAIRESQDRFGYVSKSVQRQIAEAFQLDEKIIKTIIKFMPSIKESNIEFEVICCTGPRCEKNGSSKVIKTVKESLGIGFNETTKDGKIRLRGQSCFKKCGLGPNIMVNGVYYHNMDEEKTKELMNRILK